MQLRSELCSYESGETEDLFEIKELGKEERKHAGQCVFVADFDIGLMDSFIGTRSKHSYRIILACQFGMILNEDIPKIADRSEVHRQI